MIHYSLLILNNNDNALSLFFFSNAQMSVFKAANSKHHIFYWFQGKLDQSPAFLMFYEADEKVRISHDFI